MRRALVLSLLTCALGAQGITVFREPDKATKREIENDLISGRGIGEGTLNARRKARARLIEIGGWTVPFLERAVAGTKAAKSPLVRANAAFVATRIGDDAIVDDLLLALKKDKSRHVVRVATLALGWLGTEPAGTKDRRAAALALAKLRPPQRPPLDEGGRLPRGVDQHAAAAYILADAIAWHQPVPAQHLEHKTPLVRRAAATAFRLRPDGQREGDLLQAIKRESRAGIKALQFHALGALPRTEEVWGALTKALRDPDRVVQIAAALELGSRPGQRDDYKTIRAAYRGARPAAKPAFMAALLATGDPAAIDELLNASPKQQYFAAGVLLRHLALGDGTEPRYQEIATKIARWRDLDPLLKGLADVVRYSQAKPEARRREAIETLARLPRGGPVWQSPDERTWAMVDDLLLRIFELDALSDFANLDSKARKTDTAITGDDKPIGREKENAVAVTPEEQDLADFLRPGYFRAGDLHVER